MANSKSPITYKDAGVDIDAGNALVEKIKQTSKKTERSGVLGALGGFGACFELPTHYKQPVLVSGTDGVGTKLRLAIDFKQHETVGIDLVAMCVNDIIVQGAEPLFFLDYYATGKLEVDVAADVIAGIGQGCELAGCALVGGETAEMPGMYPEGDYDLAGFCVGIVEKDTIIDGQTISAGDSLIALASSGPHSNGYSLIRKVLEREKAELSEDALNARVKQLLTPTRVYVKPLLELMQKIPVRGLSHITGGGLLENIPRVLPSHCVAEINDGSWEIPEVFRWLQEAGNIEQTEMYRTFNCGVGMVIIVPEAHKAECIDFLNMQGEKAWALGQIVERKADEEQVQFV